MYDRKVDHDQSHQNALYSEGCWLCDVLEGIHAVANGHSSNPPWITEEEALLQDISMVLRYFNIPSGKEMRKALKECW